MPRPQWQSDDIADPVYRDKFVKLPEIISSWIEPLFPLQERRMLDFGCGEGTTALGMALQYPTSRVFGVDINSEHERCLPAATEMIGLKALPGNLAFRSIKPGEVGEWEGSFDLIYSWSVFEHINRNLLDSVILQLRNILASQGVLFVQIAPLYYSAYGSHLRKFDVPAWGHLLKQESNLKAKVKGDASKALERREAVWSCYQSLNKLTADELIDRISNSGLTLLREYRTHNELKPPKRLRKIFHLDILTTNQVVATFAK